jgi:hypothetical protein
LRQKRGTFGHRPPHSGVIAVLDLFPAVRVHRSKCTIFPVASRPPGAGYDIVDDRRSYR